MPEETPTEQPVTLPEAPPPAPVSLEDIKVDPAHQRKYDRVFLGQLLHQQATILSGLESIEGSVILNETNLRAAANRARESYKLLLALMAEVA